MEKLQIIVDSACDISEEKLKKHNIKLLPFRIIVDQDEFLDGININKDKLFMFLEEKRYITTAQVRALDFEKEFKHCAENNLKCIYLAFSSKMSGAYQTAKLVAENVKKRYPNFNYEIIDTKSGSTAIELILEKTIQFQEEKLPFDQIVSKVKGLVENIEHIFTLETLERLKTGGRISKTAAFVGEFLNIKPILEVKEGKIELFKKVRGYSKAYENILDIMQERSSNLKDQVIGISYSGDRDKALKLRDMIEERFGTKKFLINMISNVLAVHLGRSGVGVYFENNN